MIIRDEQKQVLSEYVLDRFVHDAADKLRQSFPDKTANMEDPELASFVRKGIDQAYGYDIRDQENVLRYLTCLMIYGEEFGLNSDTQWAGQILQRKNINAATKMDLIDWHEFSDQEDL
jgi:hypothetical protein